MNAPKNRGLSAVLLTSEQPKKIAEFYNELLGLGLKEEAHGGPVHWACGTNGQHFAIHQAKTFNAHTYPVTTNSNNTHLFFTIENMDEMQDHLKKMHVELVCPLEKIGPMTMATIKDPDGRIVMLGTPWN